MQKLLQLLSISLIASIAFANEEKSETVVEKVEKTIENVAEKIEKAVEKPFEKQKKITEHKNQKTTAEHVNRKKENEITARLNAMTEPYAGAMQEIPAEAECCKKTETTEPKKHSIAKKQKPTHAKHKKVVKVKKTEEKKEDHKEEKTAEQK